MINRRDYANIVQTTDPLYFVYGVIYSLLEEDEKLFDWIESVPWAYTKEIIPIDIWFLGPSQKLDLHKEPEEKQLLVYIDRERVSDGIPMTEYVHRINKRIHDAVQRGMPLSYVNDVIRKYIPADSGEVSPGQRRSKRFSSIARHSGLHRLINN